MGFPFGLTVPPGPKPPGTPGDCDALAAICEAYAQALGDEVHAAGRVHAVVGSELWTGRSANYINNAVSRWQDVVLPVRDALWDLATLLSRAADELASDQAAWQRRSDAYEDAVRDQNRRGRA